MQVKVEALSPERIPRQDGNAISFDPITFKGQGLIPLATVTVKGDGGAESTYVLLFSSKTGQIRTKLYEKDKPTNDFDQRTVESTTTAAGADDVGREITEEHDPV